MVQNLISLNERKTVFIKMFSIFLVSKNIFKRTSITRVIVWFTSGTVKRRWKPVAVGNRHDIELYLRVSHLSVSNDEKTSVLITNETVAQFEQFWRDNSANTLLARDLIVASICPQVSR